MNDNEVLVFTSLSFINIVYVGKFADGGDATWVDDFAAEMKVNPSAHTPTAPAHNPGFRSIYYEYRGFC